MGRRYGSTFWVRSPGRNPSRSPASTAGRSSTMRTPPSGGRAPTGGVRQVLTLMLATRADAAARHVHSLLVRVRVRGWRAGLALVQREMHALRRHLLGARELEKLAQRVLGTGGERAAHTKAVAAAADAHLEALLGPPQGLIRCGRD